MAQLCNRCSRRTRVTSIPKENSRIIYSPISMGLQKGKDAALCTPSLRWHYCQPRSVCPGPAIHKPWISHHRWLERKLQDLSKERTWAMSILKSQRGRLMSPAGQSSNLKSSTKWLPFNFVNLLPRQEHPHRIKISEVHALPVLLMKAGSPYQHQRCLHQLARNVPITNGRDWREFGTSEQAKTYGRWF